jgi:hypothetical protein
MAVAQRSICAIQLGEKHEKSSVHVSRSRGSKRKAPQYIHARRRRPKSSEADSDRRQIIPNGIALAESQIGYGNLEQFHHCPFLRRWQSEGLLDGFVVLFAEQGFPRQKHHVRRLYVKGKMPSFEIEVCLENCRPVQVQSIHSKCVLSWSKSWSVAEAQPSIRGS